MFGACLLVDCHSMPSHGIGRAGAKTDFVLGDAHGTACNPLVTQFIERTLGDLGYVVRRNDPYAGGYITRHYGRPREQVHVVQLEIARELYMDEARIEPLPRFAAVRQDMTALIEAIARTAAVLLPA
jgi:N-formylglutamate amidohydrolase